MNEGCGRSHWGLKEEEPVGFTGRLGQKHTNAATGGGGKQEQNISIKLIRLFANFTQGLKKPVH